MHALSLDSDLYVDDLLSEVIYSVHEPVPVYPQRLRQ